MVHGVQATLTDIAAGKREYCSRNVIFHGNARYVTERNCVTREDQGSRKIRCSLHGRTHQATFSHSDQYK